MVNELTKYDILEINNDILLNGLNLLSDKENSELFITVQSFIKQSGRYTR